MRGQKMMLCVGILISGRGSNMEAVIKASKKGKIKACVTIVISDNPEAPGLIKAQKAGIPTKIVTYRKGENREDAEKEIAAIFDQHSVELVVLAGFMRLVSPWLIARYPGRMINIHPSLLPAFPGLEAQKQALKQGVKVSGCTVHLVDSGCDTGPILLQEAVPVLAGDTPETLSARILEKEHILLPKAIDLFARNKVKF